MSPGERENYQAGFTLVEILVVLTITAIAFGIGVAGLSLLRQRVSPDTIGQRIIRMLNEARDRAVNHGRSEAVVIDMKNYRFTGSQDDPVEIPREFRIEVKIGQETFTEAQKLPVQFLADGTSSGVEVDLSNKAGKSVHITTNWLTGLTRLEDVDP